MGYLQIRQLTAGEPGRALGLNDIFPVDPQTSNGSTYYYPISALINLIPSSTPTTQTNITAHAGGGQSGAYALTAQYSQVTTVASAGDSVVLPTATVGLKYVVLNSAAANACAVFPAGTNSINGLSAGTSISLNVNTQLTVICFTAGTWQQI